MARAFFLFFFGLLGIFVESSSQIGDQMTVGEGGHSNEIANLDYVFHSDAQPSNQEHDQVLKAGKGKEKRDKKEDKKKKKKKKEHSSSDSDDGKGKGERRSNRSVVVPGGERERVQQQEVIDNGRNHHVSREDLPPIADEESRTVRGSIRRKPLIFPHDS